MMCSRRPERRNVSAVGECRGDPGGWRDWGGQVTAACVGESTGPHTWPWAGKSSRTRQLTLAATARAVGLARRATHEALASWQMASIEDTAALLVSELVTNTVRHARTGGSALELRLESAGAWLRIEVHDADPNWPAPRTPDRLDGSGFGFVLIEALADKWGVRKATIGKAVWVELDTRPGAGPGI
jgi:serine/threonine-protein kinase RsbW